MCVFDAERNPCVASGSSEWDDINPSYHDDEYANIAKNKKKKTVVTRPLNTVAWSAKTLLIRIMLKAFNGIKPGAFC